MRQNSNSILAGTILTILIGLMSFGCSDDDDNSTPAGPSGTWNWEAVGTGVNDRIFALAEYNGDLYAGGFFDSAGGVAAGNIACWNDSVWGGHPYGVSTNGEVSCLGEYNGYLAIGGSFDQVPGWGGSFDNFLLNQSGGIRNHDRPNGRVYDVIVLDSNIIVAGDFSAVGSVAANNIASFNFNSNSWSTLGSGTDGPVHSLTIFNNKLYTGGHFVHAGGATANNIAVWHDSAGVWGPCLTGVSYDADTANCVVDALESYNNRLYVGGLFSSAGGTPVNNIASYALSGWQACGTGTHNIANGHIKDLTVFDNKLIAGGYFSSMGGVSNTNHIAAWNGSSWSALGEGVNGDYWPHVWGMCECKSNLYVGGRFTVAGTDSTAGNVACWSYTPD